MKSIHLLVSHLIGSLLLSSFRRRTQRILFMQWLERNSIDVHQFSLPIIALTFFYLFHLPFGSLVFGRSFSRTHIFDRFVSFFTRHPSSHSSFIILNDKKKKHFTLSHHLRCVFSHRCHVGCRLHHNVVDNTMSYISYSHSHLKNIERFFINVSAQAKSLLKIDFHARLSTEIVCKNDNTIDYCTYSLCTHTHVTNRRTNFRSNEAEKRFQSIHRRIEWCFSVTVSYMLLRLHFACFDVEKCNR